MPYKSRHRAKFGGIINYDDKSLILRELRNDKRACQVGMLRAGLHVLQTYRGVIVVSD